MWVNHVIKFFGRYMSLLGCLYQLELMWVDFGFVNLRFCQVIYLDLIKYIYLLDFYFEKMTLVYWFWLFERQLI